MSAVNEMEVVVSWTGHTQCAIIISNSSSTQNGHDVASEPYAVI